MYPAVSVGSNASVVADVGLLETNGQRTWYTAIPEGMSVSHLSLVPLKGCMLLRLGEGELARDYWITCERCRLEYEDAIWSRARSGTNPPAPRAQVELPGGDPYLGWATDWTWALFDRAICAHMRGDDGLALASARALVPIQQAVEKEAERRGLKRQPVFDFGPSPAREQPYLNFLDPLPGLLADQERRLLKLKRPTVAEAGITNYPDSSERIAALIEDLDEISVRQYGQPGGLGGFGGDFAVSTLIKEGTNAIEPLLKCLETDAGQRLTRSVSFGRDFQRSRWTHPVQEPVLEILHGIMQADMFGTWATTNELAAAGTNKSRITAAQIRAYWRKFRGVSLEEQWYVALLDDHAGTEAWRNALRSILSPVPGRTSVSSNEPPRLRGDPLRSKKNPSITELFLKRQPSLKPYGVAGFFNEMSEIDDWLSFAKWDALAALPFMQAQMRSCLDRWKTPFDEWEFERNEFSPSSGYGWHGPTACSGIVLLTLERARAGDLKALDEYASWACALEARHYEQWRRSNKYRGDLCEPMWMFPTYPAVSNAANYIFSRPESPLAGALSWTNGIKNYVVEKAGTRLMVFAPFRQLVLLGLRDTNAVGSAILGTNGWLSISTPFQNSGRLIGTNYDASRTIPGATTSYRVCDYLAQQLSAWEGFPNIELYWLAKFRNEAVARCIRELGSPGVDFARRKRNKPGEDPGS